MKAFEDNKASYLAIATMILTSLLADRLPQFEKEFMALTGAAVVVGAVSYFRHRWHSIEKRQVVEVEEPVEDVNEFENWADQTSIHIRSFEMRGASEFLSAEIHRRLRASYASAHARAWQELLNASAEDEVQEYLRALVQSEFSAGTIRPDDYKIVGALKPKIHKRRTGRADLVDSEFVLAA